MTNRFPKIKAFETGAKRMGYRPVAAGAHSGPKGAERQAGELKKMGSAAGVAKSPGGGYVTFLLGKRRKTI